MNCIKDNNLNQLIKKHAVFRLVLTIIIVFLPNIPIWYKIGLILLFDFIKNVPFLWECKGPYPSLIDNEMYQKIDKCLDLFSYWICFIIIYKYGLIHHVGIKLLFHVLILRTLAVIYYLKTNERRSLFFGVDLFKECLALILIILPNSLWYHKGLFAIIVSKLMIEYRLHVQRKSFISK